VSADNWAICPRCLDRAKAAAAQAADEAAAAYGKVPADEYERLRAAAQAPVSEEAFRTFRESYEFYGAATGTITASYGAECTQCHLALSFTYEKPFYARD
jgi:uncharacterized protein CbrC (UPF0167 family)